MDRIRVLVADDQALFRVSLRTVIGAEDDLELVGEACDGEEAVQMATEGVPDVILMDLRMPKLDGVGATAAIVAAVPATRVIVLSASDESEDVFAAIKAGASGYLLKDIDPAGLPDAIRQAAAGESPMAPSVAAKILGEFSAMTGRADAIGAPAPHITAREVEILREVSLGLTNRQIGGRLFISENTVKNHVRNVLEKLHVHTKLEAVLFAIRERLIDPTRES